MATRAAYVSDEIAALFDPRPDGDFDPEADVAVDDAARLIAQGDLTTDDAEFEARGSTLRARGALDELDGRYPSKPISRKAWERQFAGSKPTRAPPEIDAGLDSDSAAEEASEEGGVGTRARGRAREKGARARAHGRRGRAGEEATERVTADSGEEDEADDEPDGQARQSRPAPGTLQAEWAELQAEEAQIARQLAADAADEQRRAREAAAQHSAWEQVFNVRILLHKALTAANQAPDPALQPDFAAHSAPARSAFAECARSALVLLADMLALNGALGAAAADGADVSEHARDIERISHAALGDAPARLVDAGWRVASAQTAAGLRVQLRALDDWSARAGLASVPGTERKFKAFQRGIGEQVDGALADPERVRARAHTVRSGRRPLGMRAVPGVGAPRDLGDGEELRCLHVYDDTDLYHAQLKEFVERQSDGARGGDAPKRALKRRRREVDRKASKGRKVSYEVHPKLQNFMCPVELAQPVAVHELFSRVFGTDGGQTPF